MSEGPAPGGTSVHCRPKHVDEFPFDRTMNAQMRQAFNIARTGQITWGRKSNIGGLIGHGAWPKSVECCYPEKVSFVACDFGKPVMTVLKVPRFREFKATSEISGPWLSPRWCAVFSEVARGDDEVLKS